MAKRVVDIFPPKKDNTFASKEAEKSVFYERPSSPIKRFSASKKIAALSLLLLLAIFSLPLFFSKAEIKVKPKTEPFDFTETVTINAKAQSIDTASKVIPGEIFERDKTLSEEFQASGSTFKKSEGTIRLYNSFTTNTETWVKGTRFVSSEGKLFLSKDRIQVPGATLKSGRIAPSFVDVPVVAAETGEDYNIGPSKFSIAAFLGTARYTSYYGESFEGMIGGGLAPVVTKGDLEDAQNLLVEKAKAELESELKRETPEGFVILAKASQDDILEKSSSVEEGKEAEKFDFLVKIKLTLVSFKLKDLEELAYSLANSKIPPEKNFSRESLKAEYETEEAGPEPDSFLINLSVSTQIYSAIDLNSLKKNLIGKGRNEAKMLLTNQPEIAKVEIGVFPFWLQSLPKNLERIKVVMDFKR